MSLFDTGIRPAIDEYLKAKAAEKREYGRYWSASSAGYCMRLNILKRLNIPCVPEIAEDEARTTRVFESGHIFHEWVQRITKNAGLSIAQELELQDEGLMVRGHFDDLVLVNAVYTLPPPTKQTMKVTKISKEDWDKAGPIEVPDFANAPKHLILYDYKTANSQAFNYKRDEMGYYHKMQLGTYMYMLRRFDPQIGYRKGNILVNGKVTQNQLHNLTEARILQISKDDLRMREQQLFWSLELEAEINAYWGRLNGFWKSKTLPACTCLDHDGGFMGRRSKKGKVYNPYFWQDVPCSDEWIKDKLPEGWTL